MNRSLRWFRTLGAVAVLGASLSGQDPRTADTIRLHNGNVLEGRILAETRDSVTIRIGPGQEVEIPKSVIASYTRTSAEEGGPGEPKAPRLPSRDQWFRLRDPDGTVIGKLHLVVRATGEGGYVCEEQWIFEQDRRRTLVHKLERYGPQLAPMGFVYRQAVAPKDAPHRVVEELTTGTVGNGHLVVERVGPEGRSRHTFPFPAGNQLPLLVDELLRRGAASGARSFHASLYDPLDGVFELRRYDLVDQPSLPETLAVRGRGRRIDSRRAGRLRREWVGNDGDVVLIEANGVDLVAEPVPTGTGVALEKFGTERGPRTHLELWGLDVWLPLASWRFGAVRKGSRQVGLVCGRPEVSAFVARLPDPPPQATLQQVASDCVRRLRLDLPWFRETSRELEGDFVRVDGGGKGPDGRLWRGRVYLREGPESYVAVVLAGPTPEFVSLAGELRSLVERLQPSRRP